MSQPAQNQQPPGTEQRMRPAPDHGETSYLNEHEDAEDTRKWVRAAGRKAVLIPGDLTDPAHCRTVIDRTVEELGRYHLGELWRAEAAATAL